MMAIQTSADKGVKAMGNLFSITKGKEIPIKHMLQLFDTYVASILHYSCETWGFTKAITIERVHRKYLKRILGVKLSTNNHAIYGELGRYPLYITRYVRIAKYFLIAFYKRK